MVAMDMTPPRTLEHQSIQVWDQLCRSGRGERGGGKGGRGRERERERERKVNCLLLTHVHMNSMFTKLLLINSLYQNHLLSLNLNKHHHTVLASRLMLQWKHSKPQTYIYTHNTQMDGNRHATHKQTVMYSPRSRLALHP